MLGVVVPVFNESERFNEEWWDFILSNTDHFWFFVNDGSTDDSKLRLEKLTTNHLNAEIANLEKNIGKSEAIRFGINELTQNKDFRFVAFIDFDCPFDKKEVLEFLVKSMNLIKQNDFNAIFSSRIKLAGSDIKRNSHRHVVGRIINTILGFKISNLPYDSQCGLKVFDIDLVKQGFFKKPFKTTWFFEIELIIRCKKNKSKELRILEIPINHWHEVAGGHLGIKSTFQIALQLARILLMKVN